MSELPPEPPHEPSEFHHSRREHAGEIDRLNEDQLAELTEEERVDAGVAAYDPDEVPPATDDPVPTDVTDSPVYQDAQVFRLLMAQQVEGARRYGMFGCSLW